VDAATREALEARVRTQVGAGAIDAAFTTAIAAYGGELFGFLVGLSRDRAHAEDVYASACERIWRGLARFEWRSSFRVWAYQIARNELLRTARARNRAKQQVRISEVASVQLAVAHMRSTTAVHERTDVKDRFAALRAELPPEDLMLLGLRIEQRMAWPDIVTVLGTGDPAAATREAAALRKRFERLKTKLRERAH
jgi:RNA polymerase sigma-70 factor (ECF subfamily)